MSTRLTLLCSQPTSDTRTATFSSHADGEAFQPGSAAIGASARVIEVPRWERIAHAWTSPAPSAMRTAEAAGLHAAIDATLRDCDFGRWAGRPIAVVEAEEPDAIAAWATNPSAAPHGGESVIDLLFRIGPWLDAQSGHAGHTVAVTHPAVIRAAIIHAIQATPASFWRIDAIPLSITDLRFQQGRWRLRSTGCLP